MGIKMKSDEKYLKRTFEQFDKNKDGTISYEELKQVLQGNGTNLDCVKEIHEIIKLADKNGDGFIDYNELISMMQDGKLKLWKAVFIPTQRIIYWHFEN